MTTLGVFARLPAPGSCKTRLARALGPLRAAELAGAFLHDTLRRFSGAAARRIVCFTPDTDESRTFFATAADPEDQLWPQPDGDLGVRLARFFDHAFTAAGGRVLVIGSDSPTLPLSCVALAFDALHRHDCVLGPSADGGYYLLGLRVPCPLLFSGITWGTAAVFEQTLHAARSAGLSVNVGPPWYDVDTVDDLERLRAELAGIDRASDRTAPLKTIDVLARHG